MGKPFKTTIGGSALIEGIMMRGPDKMAIVVAGPDGQVCKEELHPPLREKYPIAGWPLIRGVVGFVDSMRLSMSALNYSASLFPDEDGKESGQVMTVFAMVLGVLLAMGLFIALPTFLIWLLGQAVTLGVWRTALESGLRMAMFVLYIALVSQMKDIRRVFAYHGAEHKTIHCYESGDELTVENVRRHSRFHPRCGTSFILMVVIIGFVVFVWVQVENPLWRFLLKLAFLPIVVAISYEINRLLGKYDHWLCRVVRAPGLALQRLTTKEPDDGMIEVGIEALRRVIPEKTGKDEWK